MTDRNLKSRQAARVRFSRDDLEHYRSLLLGHRRAAIDEVERMRHHLKDIQETVREAAYSSDPADGASGLRERDDLHLMIARQHKYVRHLDQALVRIEDGTYGFCLVTGDAIPKRRLEAVPHTTTCVEAKQRQRRGSRYRL